MEFGTLANIHHSGDCNNDYCSRRCLPTKKAKVYISSDINQITLYFNNSKSCAYDYSCGILNGS